MADNDDWDLGDFDAPEPSMPTDPNQAGNTPQQNNRAAGQGNNQQVAPVKLSRGKTGLLIVVVLILVVILLITIKSCSLEKNVNTPANQGTANAGSSSVTQNSEISGENSNNNPDSSAVSLQSSSASSENSNSSVNPPVSSSNEIPNQGIVSTPVESNQSPQSSVPQSSGGGETVETPLGNLMEVNMPSLSTEIETNGIVVGKHVYYFQGSYIYGVHVSVLFGDATKSVYYFCPKKTFDALRSADAIKVTYSFDSAGNVSITSITK